MVMQDGEQQEVVLDQIDEEQQSLDAQLEGEPPEQQQAVTLDMFNQMRDSYESRNQQLSNHISGLEGRIDKQANAIRVEMQAQQELLARQAAEAAEKNLLDTFGDSPEQQEALRLYLASQKAAQRPPEPTYQEPPLQQASPQQTTAADWAQVQSLVRMMGANPDDPRIDYTVLVNATLTAEQRQERFLKNLGSVVASPAQQTQPAQQAQPQTQTPPRSAGPVGNGYRNAEDLMDAFVSGQIEQDKYRELAPKFGIPL
jgi:hypothetical protein